MTGGADPFSSELPGDPLAWTQAWLDEAARSEGSNHPLAVSVATIDAAGRPAVRMLICRGYDAVAGSFTLYTDRRSEKGRELEARPQAALVFYWGQLGRQLRVRGPVIAVPEAEADAHFAARPVGVQLASWVSAQSRPLTSPAELQAAYAAACERFRVEDDARDGPGELPRPEHWVGYRVFAECVEFWVQRAHRLHDRARYERSLEPRAGAFEGGPWCVARLQP